MEPGEYYHIYTHANGSENLFREEENYRYFVQRLGNFIPPVAHTLAYCLMPNHLHLLVQIKNKNHLKGFKNPVQNPNIILRFSHLFNAYSKAYNKRCKRMGSLFTRSFHRKKILSDQQLTALIRYIHLNPVNHGFVNHPGEWAWSSYTTVLSHNCAVWLTTDLLIQWFGSLAKFKKTHELPLNPESPDIR